MVIGRRGFLRIAASGGALAASGAAVGRAAKAPASAELPPEAVGMLYDATLCIGCKACMVGCKKANTEPGGVLYDEHGRVPYEYASSDRIWDAPAVLTASSLSVIKVRKDGNAATKDAADSGYSFIKRNCMHCLAPACASVCPVGALSKEPTTGTVYYREERCIGCRYCQLGCPFDIPRFEWRSSSPRIRKCELCRHRRAEGKISACCEACPTGASLFGTVASLRQEAARRLALAPGSEHDFPIAAVNSPQRSRRKAARYVDRVYGMKEAGGTQMLVMAGVSFASLGFSPRIPDEPLPARTGAYIAQVPAVVGGVFVLSTASWLITRRRKAREEA